MMLPVTDVVFFLIDSDTGLEPSTDEMDMNRMSRLLQRVPDSQQGVCPESDDEGVNVDLSNEDDCVKIIADSENFTWNRRKQGDFSFMEQDFEDEAGLVNEISQCLKFCCRQTSSLLNKNDNDAMGLEDHRGRKLGSKNL
jgi:hypothetical protein